MTKREKTKAFDEDFFYTSAIAERAAEWIRSQPKDKPLFLYSAFYAPHFPLQAPQTIIDRQVGRYLLGWDELRKRRFAKQKTLGVVPSDISLTTRPNDVPAWDNLPEARRRELDLRMATYAAQVQMLDQGVGRILEALRESGRLERTLIIFLSDNGGAASGGPFGAGPSDKIGTSEAPVRTTYGKGWATLSNTPYRMHKANTHEGGVMSPLLIHWPERLGHAQLLRDDVAHIIDITPTIVSAAGHQVDQGQFDGIDLLGDPRDAQAPVFYEHENSRAVRQGNWKLVNRGKSNEWELYDLKSDRVEQKSLASDQPDQLRQLQQLWYAWANQNHVRTN